ncbi:LOG family protein [Roseicella aquatilis]|uniref:Cytokinin riboside 5'-monophosphate phosphoribohydrolase n=1 Tax=Roseicella aquatilis TaxID=2527868 RepID=A0A4R4DWP7_9PROT|nr:TIGR00730 family Rossman fold protein [Roseicella aquatilis]TCZ65931.1 TIGR00730 family Rossman fold protein [Roseicella aquatilis]
MPQTIRSVAVFCGTRPGTDPSHLAAARALGAGLAEAGIRLVYGGGGVGLMGAVAEGTVAAGGQVHGVIPEFLTRVERPYPDATELEVTASMHTRKTRMFELSDAFITLSGGLGTLDETVEIITWRQLGLHDKPIIILDIHGWAQSFLALVDSLIEQGFVDESHRRLYAIAPDVPAALAMLQRAPLPETAAPPERL